jgi:hypothetical protein
MKPVALWLEGRKDVAERLRDIAENAGLPAYLQLSRRGKFFRGLKRHFKKKPMKLKIPHHP